VSFDFKPNPRGGEVASRTREYLEHLQIATITVAEEAKVAFEAQGPHPYSGEHEPGGYVDSIEPVIGAEGGTPVGVVIAGVDYAWYIEVGTSDTPTFQPLQHGADAAGLVVEARPGSD